MKVREAMRREVFTIGAEDDVALAVQLMLRSGVRHLPVVQDGMLVGVLGERDILASKLRSPDFGPLHTTVGEVMTTPAQHVHPDAELTDAAALMAVHRVGCLPVLEEQQHVVGILTPTEVLEAAERRTTPRRPLAQRSVRDVMTEPVHTAHEDDHLLDSVARMNQYGTRHLPVVDADGRLVGIVSDRDVRTAIGSPGRGFEESAPTRRLQELRVGHVMTPDPRTVDPDAPLANALVALLHGQFSAVPVADDENRVVGIVSYLDLLRAAVPHLTGASAA